MTSHSPLCFHKDNVVKMILRSCGLLYKISNKLTLTGLQCEVLILTLLTTKMTLTTHLLANILQRS
jgi:hypothetical protein